MPGSDAVTTSPRGGFLRAGWRELGRKWERRKLQRRLAAQGRKRDEALTAVGQRAWQEQIDLSGFPDLRAQLSRLDERAGELSAAARALEAESAALEERRATEITTFDGQRKAVEEQKRPVDAALRSARDQHAARARALQTLEARAAALAGELTAVESRLTALAASSSPDSQTQLAAVQIRRQQLLAEKAHLAGDVPKAQAELPGLTADVSRLMAESQQHAASLARIESARKAALAAIDGPLDRVRAQLRGSGEQSTAVQKERGDRFAALGLALYTQKVDAAPLTDPIGRVRALDDERAATEAALQASRAESLAMPQRTMPKFFATAALIPSLALAATFAATSMDPGWNPLQRSNDAERREGSGRRRCEPLESACDRLKDWNDCVRRELDALGNDIDQATLQLAAEQAAHSSPPEQAVWQPAQYTLITAGLQTLRVSTATLRPEATSPYAQAMAECGQLPGPEDPAECRAAAQRVDDALTRSRSDLERDLNNAAAQYLGTTRPHVHWTSVAPLLVMLPVRQTAINQCGQ